MLAQFYQFNGLLEDLLYLVAFILTFALLGLDFKNNFKHLRRTISDIFKPSSHICIGSTNVLCLSPTPHARSLKW